MRLVRETNGDRHIVSLPGSGRDYGRGWGTGPQLASRAAEQIHVVVFRDFPRSTWQTGECDVLVVEQRTRSDVCLRHVSCGARAAPSLTRIINNVRQPILLVHRSSKSRALAAYPVDLVQRVTEQYDADAIGQVHLWLEGLGSDRLARCALFLANGSIEKLREAVQLGRRDYRDLIVSAEYDRSENRLRDFNLPFE